MTLRNKLSHSLCFGCRVWALKVPKASWVISHYIAVTEGCAVNTEIIWAMVNDSAVRATGLIKDRASCTRHLSGPWITHTHTGRTTENANLHPQLSFVLSGLSSFQLLDHLPSSSGFFSSISPPFTRGNGCLHSVSKLLEACYCWWQMNDIGIEASQAQGEPLSNGNRSRERERSQHNEKAIYFSNKDKCATLISVWLIWNRDVRACLLCLCGWKESVG